MKLTKHLTPTYSYSSLDSISPQSLVDMGKKLILIDIDNTLVGWRSPKVTQEIVSWVAECHSLGLQTCIISNAFKLKRLQSISSQINSKFVQGYPKPFTHMFQIALKKYNVQPKEAIMIGDQIFTDVLGGNLSNIQTILVTPVTTQDSIFTKFNRLLEKPFRKNYAYHQSPSSLKQFFRFILVGGSCTLIDFFIHYFLMFHNFTGKSVLGEFLHHKIVHSELLIYFQYNDIKEVEFVIFKIISTSIALFYGFFLHRQWTFQSKGKKRRQFTKFLIISFIGILINTFISSILYKPQFNSINSNWLLASIIGSGIAAVWSFFGHRLWTFNKRFFDLE